MERNKTKIFFDPELLNRLEASIGDTEAGDGNGWVVETG